MENLASMKANFTVTEGFRLDHLLTRIGLLLLGLSKKQFFLEIFFFNQKFSFKPILHPRWNVQFFDNIKTHQERAPSKSIKYVTRPRFSKPTFENGAHGSWIQVELRHCAMYHCTALCICSVIRRLVSGWRWLYFNGDVQGGTSKAACGGTRRWCRRRRCAAAWCGGGQTGDLTIISAGADLADTAFYLSHTRRSHFTATVN